MNAIPTKPMQGSNGITPSISKRQQIIQENAGMTGVGKTYATIQEIKLYLKNHPVRKVLIFDVSKELKYRVAFPQTIRINEIAKFNQGKIAGRCKRVTPFNADGTIMDDEDMRNAAVKISQTFRSGLIIYEDIDSYFRGAKNRQISKVFTTYRHLDLDLIISHQSLAPIQTLEWQNMTLIRLHKTVDKVNRIADRVPNEEILTIAELIVDEQFQLAEDMWSKRKISEDEWKKRRSFFVYVNVRTNKIKGSISKECFIRNCRKYVYLNQRMITDAMRINSSLSREEAIQSACKEKMRYYN